MVSALFVTVFCILCLAAAVIDFNTLTIPNWLNGWLCFLFVPACIVVAPGWIVAGQHVLAGAIALVVSFILFSLRVYGGGDAKMIPAVILWIGPEHVLSFLVMLALSGGVLAVFVIVLRLLVPDNAEPRFGHACLKEKKGIPYAVAIAAAAFLSAPGSTLFASF